MCCEERDAVVVEWSAARSQGMHCCRQRRAVSYTYSDNITDDITTRAEDRHKQTEVIRQTNKNHRYDSHIIY